MRKLMLAGAAVAAVAFPVGAGATVVPSPAPAQQSGNGYIAEGSTATTGVCNADGGTGVTGRLTVGTDGVTHSGPNDPTGNTSTTSCP